jgi:hypothetical protein
MNNLFSRILLVTLLVQTQGYAQFNIKQCPDQQCIEVYKNSIDKAVITHNLKDALRPFIHPVLPPDGKGIFTENEPAHHPHQNGIYWGLKKVNDRDYFMNNKSDYYRKVSSRVIQEKGDQVSWESVYLLLDSKGEAVLQETQTWRLRETDDRFLLDLRWEGKAIQSVFVDQFFVGGLFVRMPYSPDIKGRAVNALGEVNYAGAEGHRAIWVDIGMEIYGRADWGHIAILDHPDNVVFPSPWRIDHQLGVGPSRQILGGYHIEQGTKTIEEYRMVIYGGELEHETLDRLWQEYTCESLNLDKSGN